jgi:methylmalonyl-CoA mutase cobalamin-binding domain/chain
LLCGFFLCEHKPNSTYREEQVNVIAPKNDYSYLFEAGVFGIYGPGTKLAESAIEILTLLMKSHN